MSKNDEFGDLTIEQAAYEALEGNVSKVLA
jgi:hypothetical protein